MDCFARASRLSRLAPVGLIAALAVGVASSGAAAAVTLATEGRPRAVIVVAEGARVAAEGAQVLRDHVRLISGAELPILKESALAAARVVEGRIVADAYAGKDFVLLGEGRLVKELGLSSEGLGAGGVRLAVRGNVLALFGADAKTPSDPDGSYYAVTLLLEELGCRYLWPGELGRVLPRRATLAVAEMDRSYTPTIQQRKIRWGTRNDRLQLGLDRLGLTGEQYDKAMAEACRVEGAGGDWMRWQRLGGTLNLSSGHAFGHLWKKYGKEHPEWFAMQPDGSRDQSRSPDRPRLCKSNPELLDTIAAELVEKLRTDPKAPRTLSISPNDGGYTTFCMCEKCKALDPSEGRKVSLLNHTAKPTATFEYVSLTDRMIFFYNEIAERVVKVYPDTVLTGDAYSRYIAPPLKRKIHPNVVIRYVPMNYLDDEYRLNSLNDWDAWAKAAPRIFFRPNMLLAGARQGALAVYTRRMTQDFRRLSERGMYGCDISAIHHNWATQGLNYYVAARMNWDPTIDVEAVVQDYCRAGFGPAAETVRGYFARIEAITDETAAKKLHVTELYTDAVLDELTAILKEAAALAAGDAIVQRRVAFLQAGLDWQHMEAAGHRILALPKEARASVQGREAIFARRTQLNQQIFRDHLLAVNVAYVEWGEGGLWKTIGWKSGGATKRREGPADEE